VAPLRFATGVGLMVSMLSFLSVVLVCYVKIFTHFSIPGFAATASILLFLGGVQLLTVGILGEYVGRIFDEVKQRPLFIVSDSVGLGNRAPAGCDPRLREELLKGGQAFSGQALAGNTLTHV
jgi:dolichol-phosphate mannosyltransferase